MQEATKNNHLKTFFTIAVSLAFAALFMWLALRGLQFGKIKESLLKANYLWILVSMVFGVLAYWFRAVRWNLLLEPMGYRVANSNSFWTIAFGYLMNLTIPRSGEVARATALYGVEGVPVDRSFGTIILERVVDLFCMLVFLLLTLVFKYNAIYSFYEKSGIRINPWYFAVFVVVLGIGLVLFFKCKDYFRKYGFLGKIISFVEGILQGILSVFHMKQKVKFILQTMGIWICYYLAAYLVCFALPETSSFTFADGFFIIVVGTLGMMVPASGGIGAYHFAMKLGISALFLSMGRSAEAGAEIGLSYAFLSHTMQLVIMLVMGGISIPVLARARSRYASEKEHHADEIFRDKE